MKKIKENGWIAQYGRLEESSREFDIEFWQSQTTEDRFRESWNLVKQYYRIKGYPEDELRLCRTVATFGKIQS